MKYHFKVSKEGVGFSAACVELEGCRSQGDTREELEANMSEALNLYLDEPSDSKAILPLPKKALKGRGIVAVAVDPKIAFATYLRCQRLSKKLTQKQTAKLLGFKNLYSYQRLESSKTANPELLTLARLKEVFPDFYLDDVV